jgi:hypothetical protein
LINEETLKAKLCEARESHPLGNDPHAPAPATAMHADASQLQQQRNREKELLEQHLRSDKDQQVCHSGRLSNSASRLMC